MKISKLLLVMCAFGLALPSNAQKFYDVQALDESGKEIPSCGPFAGLYTRFDKENPKFGLACMEMVFPEGTNLRNVGAFIQLGPEKSDRDITLDIDDFRDKYEVEILKNGQKQPTICTVYFKEVKKATLPLDLTTLPKTDKDEWNNRKSIGWAGAGQNFVSYKDNVWFFFKQDAYMFRNYFVLAFKNVPSTLYFDLEAVGKLAKGDKRFLVDESVDGINWTNARSYTDNPDNVPEGWQVLPSDTTITQEINLQKTTRYVKFSCPDNLFPNDNPRRNNIVFRNIYVERNPDQSSLTQVERNEQVLVSTVVTDILAFNGAVKSVDIFDIAGNHIAASKGISSMNVASLIKGSYIVKVIDEENVACVARFIKK